MDISVVVIASDSTGCSTALIRKSVIPVDDT
ncbi:hypothetical protein EYZ11_003411 [Aspergillus tanneri]|uniref:Uncharacterized protein n=1 Tax=Aspergillus tanneri TaxID=1220188 RepID=A0A4S3JNC0_9EURO|nr:hypothetical protein EYZ11_003411 [Aspergillus tanneri]